MSKQVKNVQNLYIHAIQDGRVAEAQVQSVIDLLFILILGTLKRGLATWFLKLSDIESVLLCKTNSVLKRHRFIRISYFGQSL